MDEQANPIPEPTTVTPNPVVADTPTTEPPQAEPAQVPVEPTLTPSATPQTEPVSEPLQTPPERPQGSLPFSKTDDRQENLVATTPHLPADEALGN